MPSFCGGSTGPQTLWPLCSATTLRLLWKSGSIGKNFSPSINFQKRQILVFLLSLLTGGCLDCEFYPQTIWGNHFYSGMVCMAKYYLPDGMRYATLDERKEFYTAEFNLAKVAEWFGERMSNVKFAVIMGRHTQISREKYRKDAA